MKKVSAGFNCKKLAVAMFVALGIIGEASAVDSAATDPVHGRAPTVTPTFENTSRPGLAPVDGETVTITPVFADQDGDVEDAITYIWKRGGSVITGVTSDSYTLTSADLGTTLTVEVTPSTDASITEPAIGSMEVVTIVAGATAGNQPTVIDIFKNGSLLAGNPIVDDVLTATPTCVATCDPSLVYTWKVDGIDAGTGLTYTVLKGDQKKAITVSSN
jgi:hypothetical protein